MERQEMRAKIVGKATQDAEFRARLLSDPKGTIEQELNVTIPASLSIEVHEASATTAHLVLPPGSRLSESDLQTVAGGDQATRAAFDEFKNKSYGEQQAGSADRPPGS